MQDSLHFDFLLYSKAFRSIGVHYEDSRAPCNLLTTL